VENMRGTLFFPRTRTADRYHIRPARSADWPAVEKLLSYANRYYVTLEWWTIQEWLDRPTFLLAANQHERGVGLALTITGDSPVAWLRAVVVNSENCLPALLEASLRAASTQGSTGIAFLAGEGWIWTRLDDLGFDQVNQVITLRRRGAWHTPQNLPDLQVRKASPADVAAIIAVDHAAFEPMWWYNREILRRALDLAYCFDVIYLGDECVGYQFSTLRDGRGHIVRLATHPRWQRNGIGVRLLSAAMTALDRAGAKGVTVNTQEDNWASLRLYCRFDFERVNTPMAVRFLSLE